MAGAAEAKERCCVVDRTESRLISSHPILESGVDSIEIDFIFLVLVVFLFPEMCYVLLVESSNERLFY